MALTGEQALAASKKFTRETVGGLGAIKGEDGFSPIITESASNTENDYRLDVTTAFASFTTDNLKGTKGDKGEQGVPGADGTTYIPSIGTVNTVESTMPAKAEVAIDEENKKAVFSFDIPKGKDGAAGGGDSSPVTIDEVMSDTSGNPVQNKVIKKYVDDKSADISKESNNAVEKKSDGLFVEDKTEEIQTIEDKVNAIKKYQKYVNTELDYCFLSFDLSKVVNDGFRNIDIIAGTIVPFDYMFNGNMEYDITGNHSIKLKANKTYKLTATLVLGNTSGSHNFGFRFYNITDNEWLPIVSIGKTYNVEHSISYIITPDHNMEICTRITNIADGSELKLRASGNWSINNNTNVGLSPSYNQSYFMAEEINRAITIDPVKYVNTDSGIEDTPVGHIIAHMGTSAPKHYLICDGAEYQIADYPYLAQHFADNFGSINYFGGDGTTTFAVPDLRGEFLRGTGINSHDNNGDGSKVGEHQDGTQQLDLIYNGYGGTNFIQLNLPESLTIPSQSTTFKDKIISNRVSYVQAKTNSGESLATGLGKYTSRPTNTSVLYCIKYEPTYFVQITGITEQPNAGFHNSIYRGKYLGDHVTDEQYAAISAGTFNDLYIGDYWIIDGMTWRIAAFDYYLNCGDTATTAHHVAIVPDTVLYNYAMNDSEVTTGGYVGSKMYNQGLAQAKTMIKAAFSGHVLSHRVYLVNAVSNGAPSAGAWCDSEVELMNEQMVYGGSIFMPMGNGSPIFASYRVEKSQLPLFALEPSRIGIRAAYWLRDAVSASIFAYADDYGSADFNLASLSLGVRPVFSIF